MEGALYVVWGGRTAIWRKGGRVGDGRGRRLGGGSRTLKYRAKESGDRGKTGQGESVRGDLFHCDD